MGECCVMPIVGAFGRLLRLFIKLCSSSSNSNINWGSGSTFEMSADLMVDPFLASDSNVFALNDSNIMLGTMVSVFKVFNAVTNSVLVVFDKPSKKWGKRSESSSSAMPIALLRSTRFFGQEPIQSSLEYILPPIF